MIAETSINAKDAEIKFQNKEAKVSCHESIVSNRLKSFLFEKDEKRYQELVGLKQRSWKIQNKKPLNALNTGNRKTAMSSNAVAS